MNAIRTISALNAQPYVITLYRKHIIEAMKIGILKGFKVGLGNGMTFGISFLTYALGFWWSGQLIANQRSGNGCSHNCFTGGTVISGLFNLFHIMFYISYIFYYIQNFIIFFSLC